MEGCERLTPLVLIHVAPPRLSCGVSALHIIIPVGEKYTGWWCFSVSLRPDPVVKGAYGELVKDAHGDQGGKDAYDAGELNQARDALLSG